VALTAALDASVLYPLPLRDTLLRAAQVGMYDPCWSERILDEVARNLAACEPFSVEPVDPDRFLLDLYRLDEDAIHTALALQAAALTRPPMSLTDILDRLEPTVPGFARALRVR
jgi:hypothetical protein